MVVNILSVSCIRFSLTEAMNTALFSQIHYITYTT